jgi:hypothetical protein
VNATVVSNTARSLRVKGRPSFGTVLVYENLTCGGRAWNFYEKLTRRFHGDFIFSHLMWSFSMLRNRRTLQLAARSAAHANIVILSFTGNAELPAHIKDWFERWVSLTDSQDLAFVTLTDHQPQENTSIATDTYLRRIVEPRKIDFFPHRSSAPSQIYPE